MKDRIKNYMEDHYPNCRVTIEENLEFSNIEIYNVTLDQLVKFSLDFHIASQTWAGSLQLFGGSLYRDREGYSHWYSVSSEGERHPNFSEVVEGLMDRIGKRDTPSNTKRSIEVLEHMLNPEGSSDG